MAQLLEEGGHLQWLIGGLEATNFDRAVELLNRGAVQKEVSEELGLRPGAVSKYSRRAREEGLLYADLNGSPSGLEFSFRSVISSQ